eukprot:7526850-Ditylum_brightwellii.AAC.1
MRIVKDFLREAIKLVNTKRPPIKFKVGEGVTDKKLGESRMHKLCMQPEEDKSSVNLLTIEVFELGSPKEWFVFKKQMKQVLKGQNMADIDAAYTLVQNLLRGKALTAFNNKQATFKDQQTPENHKHCLNAMAVQVIPNKAYTPQKQYI